MTRGDSQWNGSTDPNLDDSQTRAQVISSQVETAETFASFQIKVGK